MDPVWILVILTVAVALTFDVINGFHDAANSIATVVSTRVLRPQWAVAWAAFFNFVAMFVFAPKVADTIAKIIHIQGDDPAYVWVVLAGAGIAHAGWGVLRLEKIIPTIEFIPLAPLIGLVAGMTLMIAVYWIFRRWTPRSVDRVFRRGQLVSAALYSLGHGGNDAQKTMGIIVALLIAAGTFPTDIQLSLTDGRTLWIILGAHAAMALGTALGGWRIVKTMGMKITKLKPVGGFCAETGGAFTLFLATHLGIPVSTTHTITGAIVGVGSTRGASAVKWGVAGRIVWAWILTIPAAGLIAAGTYYATRVLH